MSAVYFATQAFNSSNISYNISEGVIADWQSGDEWSWVLYLWDIDNESWVPYEQDISSISMDADTHLAWAASNADIVNLPPGVECNGHGWVMGSGGGAHCMCDEGYERPEGDWLSCVAEDTGGIGQGNGTDPHEESLGEYEVGHSTVTFILDKQLRKRVAYSGINWDADEFLHDLKALTEE